jgi:hypothetical protein
MTGSKGECIVAPSQDCFKTLLMAQTLRLGNRRRMLERLYDAMASGAAGPEQRRRFRSLLAYTKTQAERLDTMLDRWSALATAGESVSGRENGVNGRNPGRGRILVDAGSRYCDHRRPLDRRL